MAVSLHSIASPKELIVHTTGSGDASRLYIYTGITWPREPTAVHRSGIGR